MRKTSLLFVASLLILACCAQPSGILTPKEKSRWSNEKEGSIILQEFHASEGPRGSEGPDALQFSASFGLRESDPLRYHQCWFAGFEANKQNQHAHHIPELPVVLMGQKHLLLVKDSTEQELIRDSLYVPRPIYSEVERTIKPGTRISWTVDSAGPDKYVQVQLSYTALQYYDLGVNNDELIMERVVNDKNGSYILTRSDLEGVPDSAQVNVDLTRYIYQGITTLPESRLKDFHLMRTISSTTEWAEVQRQ